jgi:hypothetical protein
MTVLVGWIFSPSAVMALELQSFGIRAGFSEDSRDEDYIQYDGFAIWALPWSFNMGSNWSLITHLEANAGMLRGSGNKEKKKFF